MLLICLYAYSRLVNGSTRQQTLSSLPGFYDVAVGENKRMYVKYEFRNRVFVMNIAEGEDFGLPQKRRSE